MKKYFILFSIVLLLNGCGAGGGGNNTNPPASAQSNIAKIKINKDGIYSIPFSDVSTVSVGLSGIPIASLKMTNNGEEIAIDVIEVDNNGIFDNGDYIEFYGKAIQRGDTRFRYTETNVYRLSREDGTRKRMEKVPGNSSSSQGASSFLKVLHNEEDTWYEQKNLSMEDVSEHWFFGGPFYTHVFAGDANTSDYRRDYNFSTYGIDKNQPVILRLRLQSINGSHHIRGYINNEPIIDKLWGPNSTNSPVTIEVSVDPMQCKKCFNYGANTFRLESVGDTSSGIYELFYLDWFEVEFSHKYQAEHNKLEFTGKGNISVTDFDSSAIFVYDITTYPDIRKIIPESIQTVSGYEAVFSAPYYQDSKFIALTSGEKEEPLAVGTYTSADLRSNKDADYIIITHEDFYDAVKPLADYRAKGYKVLTVKTGDIYNEFSSGIETPQAVKDFLSYAYNNWTTKPGFVLLVGDATIDYKDVSGYGKNNGVKSYVPAYLYNYPLLGEVPSDNWFADVDDTNGILPDMNIGRIPAKTPADVTAVTDKIISHEESINKSKSVLLVADDDLPVFETLSDSIAEIIPNGYSVKKIYQNVYSGDFRKGIIDGINSGAAILNYTGHGAVVDWTKENAFSSQDTEYLTNKGAYPFIVALNCLNGYFVMPNDGVIQDGVKQYPSIAESFLLGREQGALAVFAASSIGYPSEHDPLAKELYGVIFENDTTLGEAVTKAKEKIYTIGSSNDEDVVQTFIFFGDPATRLK